MKIIMLLFFALVCASSFAEETKTLETIKVKGTKEKKGYFEIPESVLILQENEVPATDSTNSIQVINAAPNVQLIAIGLEHHSVFVE